VCGLHSVPVGNDTSGSIKGGEFLDWPSYYQLLKKSGQCMYEGVIKFSGLAAWSRTANGTALCH